ncbi:MAG TPA: Smr/MutS family protein [Pyrinomonadaceae bacterium]|jgi:DNA mismatch repair protein MutS2|nr:Smr/MutS family protein [Pyrinomonadaceae bacterium]
MTYSLDTLEFSRLLDLVARQAQTQMGAARIRALGPLTSRIELDAALAAIEETITLNEDKQVTWSFSGMEDPTGSVAILRIQNAALEPNSLLEIARVCSAALFARSAIQPEKESVPTLWQLVEHIPPTLLAAVNEINKRILAGGEIDDSASPELARLRREINAQRQRLTRSLERAMSAAGNAIQDEIVTIRNDRFVIPVKSDFRGKVTGVAHGFSSSGNTIFVEPLEAIEANNELQNLRGQEEREVARILFALTEQLREQLPAVESAVDAVTELDAVKAKVEFARKFNAVVPEITDNELDLVDARHPLLEDNLRVSSPHVSKGQLGERSSLGQRRAAGSPPYKGGVDSDAGDSGVGRRGGSLPSNEIVPNTFALDAERQVMIISGANAGGKTVVLKTAGLLSLMAISGLPVPASEAKIPFYRSVLADIGDHQSLSANLSTFSSHMSNIASMIRECVSPSLVLLDEAGTGTDPEEGSALGVSIVDHFRRTCGAHVIASTHYRGLKIYAANDPSVVNASVEFDEKTLQPTYRLLLGLAGASSGIEIAHRFGIADDVIAAARENLDVSAQDAEAYLRRLQNETKHAEDLRIALEEEREAVAMKYANLDIDAVKREKERQKEFESQLAQAVDDFDKQSKAFLTTLEDKALKNRLEKERLSRKAELNRAVMIKLQDSATRGRGDAGTSTSRVSVPPAVAGGSGSGSPPYEGGEAGGRGGSLDNTIQVGSRVITTFGNIGTVERLDKDVAEVLVGGMRLRQKLTELELADPSVAEARTKVRAPAASQRTGRPIDAADVPAELNLIGKTTADAEYELDRFLDEAYMSSLPRVRIIHGFGTGALKNYVHHKLRDHDLVERFEFAPDSQGGHGATIAELKQ